jgi:hypothetical protein
LVAVPLPRSTEPVRAALQLAAKPKRFVLMAGAGHNDLLLVGGEPYLAVWGQFLAETTPHP